MNKQQEKELRYTGERLVTRVINSTMIEHLHRYAFAQNFIAGKEVLDIASGEGYGSNLMAKVAKSVTGVDISHEAVAHAKRKYVKNNLTYVQGSAAQIPLESERFDVVVSFETIEHHDQHEEMMSEIKRVLRKGGLLIISSPDKKNYTDLPKAKNEFHVKELYTHEFKDLISRYFRYHSMFFQKVGYGSLMVPENRRHDSGFREYTGTYDELQEELHLLNPVYNVCVASDNELDMEKFHLSFFNKLDLVEELQRKEKEYEHIERLLYTVSTSRAYRIGRFLTSPVRLLRSLL